MKVKLGNGLAFKVERYDQVLALDTKVLAL